MKMLASAAMLVLVFAGLGSDVFSQSQGELNRQAAAELEQADAQLNDIYNKVLEADSDRRRELIAAERAWLVYRDAEAEYEADAYRGGSIRPMIYDEALTTLTNERINTLRSLLRS
jgi:uncharacterized protein YecT (DUF1311 family)